MLDLSPIGLIDSVVGRKTGGPGIKTRLSISEGRFILGTFIPILGITFDLHQVPFYISLISWNLLKFSLYR